MRSIGIYIILALLLSSCSLFEQDDTQLSRASASEIKEVLVQDRYVQFTIVAAIPTPCHTFNSYKSEKINNTIYTTIFVEASSRPCAQVIASTEYKLNFTVPDPGEYTFSFWAYEGKNIETTFVIE